MKTELKDVIHLYLGCDCKMLDDENTYKLLPEMLPCENFPLRRKPKPILRRISDITSEQMHEVGMEQSEINNIITNKRNPSLYVGEFLWFLKNGFDLFGLIDSGQAIDAKTLE